MLYLSPQALQASLLAQDANRLSSGLRAMFPTVDAHEVDAAIEALDTRRCLGATRARFSHCSSPNSIAPLRSVIPQQLQVPTATSAQEQRVKLSLSWLPSSDEKPVPQLRWSPQHAASGCHGSCAVPAARPVCGCRIGFAYS
jgi:hypothetical protein